MIHFFVIGNLGKYERDGEVAIINLNLTYFSSVCVLLKPRTVQDFCCLMDVQFLQPSAHFCPTFYTGFWLHKISVMEISQ